MHIILVSSIYPPEPVVSGLTSAQIAEALQEKGHNVTVITAFPNRPDGHLYDGYSRRLYSRQRLPNGIHLIRCFSALSAESRMLSRLRENISFGFTSSLAALAASRPDVIYANTWPIFAANMVCSVARLRRIPIVVSVQDVYPDSLVAQGRIRTNGRLARWMRRMDRRMARQAAALVVPTPSFARTYQAERGVDRERIHHVPNWQSGQFVVPDDGAGVDCRKRLNIPASATVVLYGGNIGVAAGVENLIKSFQFLADQPDLYLVIAGAGNQLQACRRLAQDMQHPRILFYTPWPVAETSALLSAADILALPTQGGQSLASIPSKLITYMLAKRPIVALALPESDLAIIIDQSQCGWWLPPDQPESLAKLIRATLNLPPEELNRRGQAGRGFALANLTRDVCLPQIVQLLEHVGTVR